MMRKLHVCMVGAGFHPPWVEGYSSIARQLGNCLQNDVELSMLSCVRHDYVGGRDRQTNRESNTYLVDSHFLRKHIEPTLLDNALLSFEFRRLLKGIKSKSSVDVLHLFNVSHIMNSILLGHLPRKKIVAQICESRNLGYVFSKHAVDAYICTNRSAQRHLIAQGLSADKVFVIPPILSPAMFANASSMRRQEISSSSDRDELTITYIGNVTPRRFPVAMIDEFEKANGIEPRVVFRIYCPDWERNRSYVSNLNERARRSKNRWSINLANLTEESKIGVYNSSDIVIFPFEQDPGPMVNPPLTLLESMACGNLVVTSRAASVDEVVTDGKNGFLVEPSDTRRFVETVTRVAETHTQLRDVRDAARETILTKFSPYESSRRVLRLYESLT